MYDSLKISFRVLLTSNFSLKLHITISAFQLNKSCLIMNSTPLLIPNQHLCCIPTNHTISFLSEKISAYLHTLVFLTTFLTYRTEYRKDQKSHHLIQVGHLDKSIWLKECLYLLSVELNFSLDEVREKKCKSYIFEFIIRWFCVGYIFEDTSPTINWWSGRAVVADFTIL